MTAGDRCPYCGHLSCVCQVQALRKLLEGLHKETTALCAEAEKTRGFCGAGMDNALADVRIDCIAVRGSIVRALDSLSFTERSLARRNKRQEEEANAAH